MPQCQSARYEEAMFNNPLIGDAGINTDSVLVPLKHSESHESVIDLVDIRVLDEQDSMSVADDPIEHQASKSVLAESAGPKAKNMDTDHNSEYVSTPGSIVDIMFSTDHSFSQTSANFQEKCVESPPSALALEVLETCDHRLSHLMNPRIDGQVTQSRSPFAVRDIDELLAELGVAETFIFDPAKDVPGNRESFCSKMPLAGRPFSADPDEFSLKEIDELIEQLETNYPTVRMSSSDNKLEDNATPNNALLPAESALQSIELPKQLDIWATIPVYVPVFATSGIDEKDEASIQTLFDNVTSTSAISDFKPSGFESTATISANHRKSWALSNLPDMDVDEMIHNMETSRSRASSIATNVSEHPRQPRNNDTFTSRMYVAQNDGISISRLMCALNIAPIFVRRPFLGPSRAVVFPHFY
ncbi:hypothetical protein H4217_003730 [Coemansia sp. RSA 1939]|nr:hypothetical protein H4217_003730 [Coemansia sp. RSA 1939]